MESGSEPSPSPENASLESSEVDPEPEDPIPEVSSPTDSPSGSTVGWGIGIDGPLEAPSPGPSDSPVSGADSPSSCGADPFILCGTSDGDPDLAVSPGTPSSSSRLPSGSDRAEGPLTDCSEPPSDSVCPLALLDSEPLESESELASPLLVWLRPPGTVEVESNVLVLLIRSSPAGLELDLPPESESNVCPLLGDLNALLVLA